MERSALGIGRRGGRGIMESPDMKRASLLLLPLLPVALLISDRDVPHDIIARRNCSLNKSRFAIRGI